MRIIRRNIQRQGSLHTKQPSGENLHVSLILNHPNFMTQLTCLTVSKIRNRLDFLHNKIITNTAKTQLRNEKNYNLRHRPQTFIEGDLVLVRKPPIGIKDSKLTIPYSGPYVIK